MRMTKLASLFLTATLSLASGVALAAESSTSTQSNNGQANAAADAGQVAPDAKENVAPNNVDNDNINSGGTMLHPNGSSMDHEGMSKDEVHKNTMCKDGRCPDVNKKVETGNGINNDVDTKTDGTTH